VVENLVRSPERHFCFATFPMHRDHHWTVAALVLMMIEPAAVFC